MLQAGNRITCPDPDRRLRVLPVSSIHGHLVRLGHLQVHLRDLPWPSGDFSGRGVTSP